ncbi:unnamed protein product [Cladocopium goreaui]|uniref:Uncharacterized protein n=1 Tax=Cladocopium goreaui TaxID=2562237 RepID=A0A9P1CKG0_9DINO|nr:unnamed protein product [Cladocopium goreaui]
MHADYQAPPMTAFAPGRLQQKRPEPSSRDIFYPYPTSVKESTAHQDYQAPAMEDVRVTAASQKADDSFKLLPARFEGESTTHVDYTAPPAPSLAARRVPDKPEETQQLLRPDAPEPSQSTTHHDYRPPPLDQLRQAPFVEQTRQSYEQVCFEGQSTTHADYPAPPQDALRDSYANHAHPSQAPGFPNAILGGSRFEGESSAQRDYQAPPLEALRQMLQSRDVQPAAAQPPARFDGQSSMHADYQAPPMTAFAPGRLQQKRPEPSSRDIFYPYPTSVKESTAHQDYQAPAMEDVRVTAASQKADDSFKLLPARFEGESTTHVDYTAPPAPSLAARRVPDKPEETQQLLRPDAPEPSQSTTHHDYRPPPLDQLRQAPFVEQTRQSYEQVCFEGQSTTHADYPAPPQDALRDSYANHAHPSQAPGFPNAILGGSRFEGESSAQRDYQAPPLEALRQMLQSRDVQPEAAQPPARFDGQSSMHADYQAPPLEGLRRWLRGCGLRPEETAAHSKQDQGTKTTIQQTARFEGQSTMHQDFQAPPPVILNQPQPAAATTGVSPIRFEGESSMKAHYQAPSEEALIAATGGIRQQQPDIKVEEAKVAFEGQSTMRHDYQALPVEKLLQFLGPPACDEMAPPIPFEGESSMKAHFVAPSTEAVLAASSASLRHADLQASSQPTARFEGQSTMHQDFQAPPPVALNQPQPAAATTAVSPIRFEGESSMKAHYQAPSEEALIDATGGIRQQQPDIKVEEAKVAFEGQSTMRHDYQAPPLEKLLQFLGQPACDEMAPPIPFEGESSMKAHYAAPSTEAVLAASSASLRHADLQVSSQQTARFEGQSTMHQDFQTPPPVALNQPQPAAATTEVSPIRFEGESSMKAHYQAPSEEALIAATGGIRQQQPDIKVEEAKVAFEGQSTMRHDYQALPVEKLFQFLGPPACDEMAPPIPFEGESSMKAHYAAPSTEAVLAASSASLRHAVLQAASQQTARFEGQSTMHQDFQAPPPVALNQPQPAAATTEVSPIRFEGESSMKAHYQAPSEEALIAATGGKRQQQPDIKVEEAKVAFEGQSTMRHDYQAPPLEKLLQFLGQPACDEMAPPIPFEGESSMKAHYAAPSTEAVLAASSASLRHADLQASSQQTARFEGQSTMHQDFQTPPSVALNQPQPAAATTAVSPIRFEGESSMKAHYQAPSEEALIAATGGIRQQQPDIKVEEAKVALEGQSTMRHDYQAPPLEKLFQFLGRPVCDEMAPPIPFEGESSMKAHYAAPSTEAVLAASSASLRHADSQAASQQTARFEGQSTTHQDFQTTCVGLEPNPSGSPPALALAHFEGGSTAHHDYGVPPLEDLRQLISGTSSGSRERKLPQTTFEGESSMRAHYRAPSADALKEASRSPYQGRRSSSAHADRSSVKFEASSTSRMDYRAPPLEFWQRERLDKDATASGPPAPVTGPFEGESSRKAWCNGAPFSGSGPFDCIDPLWRSEHSRPEMSESSKVDAETEQFSMRHFPAWAVVPRSFREAEEASQMPQMSQPPQGQTVDTADRFGEVAGNHASDEYDVGPSAEGPKASRYQPRQARQEKQVGTPRTGRPSSAQPAARKQAAPRPGSFRFRYTLQNCLIFMHDGCIELRRGTECPCISGKPASLSGLPSQEHNCQSQQRGSHVQILRTPPKHLAEDATKSSSPGEDGMSSVSEAPQAAPAATSVSGAAGLPSSVVGRPMRRRSLKQVQAAGSGEKVQHSNVPRMEDPTPQQTASVWAQSNTKVEPEISTTKRDYKAPPQEAFEQVSQTGLGPKTRAPTVVGKGNSERYGHWNVDGRFTAPAASSRDQYTAQPPKGKGEPGERAPLRISQ